MAVVVDEMQVDAASQPEQRGGAGGGDGAGAEPQPPKPEDVERAFRAQLERAERVWAH
jgi:hypothetical protein